MKQKKASLQSMVEKIDWLMIEPLHRSWGLGTKEVAVSFHPGNLKEEPNKINKVKIRLGQEVISELKWDTGDKICIFQDPDHLFTFKLAKTVTGTGYRLSRENSDSFVHVIGFTWTHKVPLERMKSKIVNYHIYKNNLIIFKIGSEEEEIEE